MFCLLPISEGTVQFWFDRTVYLIVLSKHRERMLYLGDQCPVTR